MKKIILCGVLFFFAVLPTRAGMVIGSGTTSGFTQLASDSWPGADNADIGANWEGQTGNSTFQIVSTAVTPALLNTDAAENYTAITWPDDQWSEARVTVTGTNSGAGSGVGVRMSASAETWYRIVVNKAGSNNIEIGKIVAGSFSSLAFRSTTWVDGDRLRVSVTGSSTATIKIYQNDVQVGADITDASSPITSGRAGISYSSSVTSTSLDDWKGGSVP